MPRTQPTTDEGLMRELCRRALQHNRPELWEEWTENGTLDEHLDNMTAAATEMAQRPSTNPKPDETLVRVGAPHLVNAWAALMASNFLTSEDDEAAIDAA